MFRVDRRTALWQAAGCLTLPAWASAFAEEPKAEKKKAAPKKDPYEDAVFLDGPPPAIAKDSFTIAVLPDTQKYCVNAPEGFMAQTQWIVDQQEARNIACVLHLGDITDHNTTNEWEVAKAALSKLDGNVPYFLAVGNHDYSENGVCSDRTTLFNDYFPISSFKGLTTFGGVYDKEPDRMENSYHLFSAGGRNYLVICLEFGPRADVIRWANEIADLHPQRQAILTTHVYMYNDDTRYDFAKYGEKQPWSPHKYKVADATAGDVNDGEELWTKLVGKQSNFIMTLNGHVLGDGLGKTTTADATGRNIPQMLVNFQMKPKGGDGWLRLMEFKADGTTVDIVDYSPTRNQQNVSAQNRFTIAAAPIANA